MNASVLVLAAWFSIPLGMAGAASYMEARKGPSDAQNAPVETRTERV